MATLRSQLDREMSLRQLLERTQEELAGMRPSPSSQNGHQVDVSGESVVLRARLDGERERLSQVTAALGLERLRAASAGQEAGEERERLARQLEAERAAANNLRRALQTVQGQNEALFSEVQQERDYGRRADQEKEDALKRVEELRDEVSQFRRRREAERTVDGEERRGMEMGLEEARHHLTESLHDMRSLGQQVSILREELEQAKEREKQLRLELNQEKATKEVPEPLLQRMRNVNEFLADNIAENSKIKHSLLALTEERRGMRERITALQAQLERVQAEGRELASRQVPPGWEATLSTERKLWEKERARMKQALAHSEAEAAMSKITGEATRMEVDPSAVMHLYARCLRAESYRKALTWQKRYLLAMLNGADGGAGNVLSSGPRDTQITVGVPGLTMTVYGQVRGGGSGGSKHVDRFRVAALTVLAVLRMKFMVQRWYRGRKMTSRLFAPSKDSPRHFTVPYAFLSEVPSITQRALFGHRVEDSPPTRDKRPAEDNAASLVADGGARGGRTVARDPLGQYIDRFDQVHRRLGHRNK